MPIEKEDTNVNKVLLLAFLCGGVALVIVGFSVSQALASATSRFIAGILSDKATWMVVGGVVLFIIGLMGLVRRPEPAR